MHEVRERHVYRCAKIDTPKLGSSIAAAKQDPAWVALRGLEKPLHGGNQLGSRRRFGYEGIRADGSACGDRFWRIVDGEENNFGGRRDSAYLVGSLNAIHHRHINVEENEVRMQLLDLLDSLLAVFSLAANVHGMPGKKRANGLSRHLIIVHH
jgi:hypothetical protein